MLSESPVADMQRSPSSENLECQSTRRSSQRALIGATEEESGLRRDDGVFKGKERWIFEEKCVLSRVSSKVSVLF